MLPSQPFYASVVFANTVLVGKRVKPEDRKNHKVWSWEDEISFGPLTSSGLRNTGWGVGQQNQ